jgi:hypothetical protein
MYQQQSFKVAVGILLQERSHDRIEVYNNYIPMLRPLTIELDTSHEEGIKSLESKTFLRWAFFTIGTLPPVIKLASMKGVPWVQAWGMMFLTYWLVNESLVLFSALNQDYYTISQSGLISWPGYEQSTRTRRYHHAQRLLFYWKRCLAMTALIFHTVIINGVFRVFSRRLWWPSNASAYNAIVMGYSYITTVSLGLLLVVALLCCSQDRFRTAIRSTTVITVLATFLIMIGSTAGNAMAFANFVFPPASAISFLELTSFVLFLQVVARFLGRRYAIVGKNLQVVYIDEIEGELEVDNIACSALAFWLITILGSILWYSYIYDPSNTFSPKWTGIFG